MLFCVSVKVDTQNCFTTEVAESLFEMGLRKICRNSHERCSQLFSTKTRLNIRCFLIRRYNPRGQLSHADLPQSRIYEEEVSMLLTRVAPTFLAFIHSVTVLL
jgi:hypothetical protein